MVLQLFIGLLALAATSLLITQGRRKRVWSALMLLGLGLIGCFLFENTDNAPESGFVYQWLSYDILKANINISSSAAMRQLFLPLLFLLGSIVYLTTLSHSEQHALHFDTILVLDFIGLILLASARDFMQLMFASALLSIVCFYISPQLSNKKYLFTFSFLSEMALFMALAIVYGGTASISLQTLPKLGSLVRHRDLVAGLILLATASKCGLLGMAPQYRILNTMPFNRIIGLLLFSQPLIGLIIAVKLRPLLALSPIFDTALQNWAGVSVVGGLVLLLLQNHLSSRLISFALLYPSFALYQMLHGNAIIYELVPHLLFITMSVAVILFLAYQGASQEDSLAHLGGFWRYTKVNLVLSLALSAVIISELTLTASDSFGRAFAFAYVINLALVLKQIYFGATLADDKTTAFAHSANLWYALPILGLAGGLIYLDNTWNAKDFQYLCLIGLGTLILAPARTLLNLSTRFKTHSDILLNIYTLLFVTPLKFFGRILWLSFDIVVIERRVIGTVSFIMNALITALHKMQQNTALPWIINGLIGLTLLALYWGFYIYG